jgi:hypothetical protein
MVSERTHHGASASVPAPELTNRGLAMIGLGLSVAVTGHKN